MSHPPRRGRRPNDPRRGRASGPSGGRPPQVDPARQVAAELLAAVRADDAYANLKLPELLAAHGLSGRDAALATELSYGTSRTKGQLDAILSACSTRPLDSIDPPVLDALRLGAYQLLRTRIPPHAAVSATVDLVRAGGRPGAAGFVNALLRKVSAHDLDGWLAELAPASDDDPTGHLALTTAHPSWIVDAIGDALGPRRDELADALAADNQSPAVHLVARPGRIARDELTAESGGTPARYSPYGLYLPAGNPGALAAVADGRAAVQDEGSQLVALTLAEAPLDGSDERWLDLAAGPGGKAGLLGALAARRGATVDAVEISPHRADLVRRTVSGLPVTVHTADGRDPGLPAGSYDRVLLDAPCTGLGALRRRPEARWRRQPADVAELTRLQRDLLQSAAGLVRPGGLIGYVTCSPHLVETAAVLNRRPKDLEIVDATELVPGNPAADAPLDGPVPGTVQLWPHRHGTDAMFLALLRRS
ncbi:RsmB/NOP family class I SAM-dependent RNA methyltransferase [Nakamurella aerolata]|uniref:rRNA small subunit methyltransferase B n=1 Tax=Nakamurella aerolata TaxID=1656892 RepID=A0A849AAT6_9ACTN|nr:transcription antitermination factor NusB [Nakamurella aerolata]NNG36241.1 rRNA small subunit methyltransferase B [Nakamurella aerolata]